MPFRHVIASWRITITPKERFGSKMFLLEQYVKRFRFTPSKKSKVIVGGKDSDDEGPSLGFYFFS